MRAMRIELVIDELVLHGLDPRHRHAIGDAVQRELARQLASRAIEHSWTAMSADAIDAGSLRLAAGLSPALVGQRIAQSVMAVVSLPPETASGPGGGRRSQQEARTP
jgi:hypothetical protein